MLNVERFLQKRMKRYLITGASRGIGRAIAEKLAAPEVVLLLHGRDTVALAETRKAVESHCGKVSLLMHRCHRSDRRDWRCTDRFAR